ncbi:MAG: zinc ribbon domain-containing protein [Clostridiales bacterium]|nr:zinc ribbon domain-containing protein [Clostridiales bacterium]
MAKKKNRKNIPLPILILICAILLFAMYTSLSTLALAIWGDSVMGTVDIYSSRLDDTNAEQNRSRTVSKGYWFMADGKEYRGYVMYSSDEAWPSLAEGETRDQRIRYLDIFPYINKPSALCEFDEMGEAAIIYHIFSPFACVFLLLLVTGTFKRKKRTKKAAKKIAAPQNNNTRSDTDMFCHNCGNRLPEGAAYCSSCGAKIQAGAPAVCTACGADIPDDAEFCINCGTAANTAGTPTATVPSVPPQAAYAMPPQSSGAQHMGLVGFSERCNSPEILAAAQKNKKFSIGCMWILVFVPLIGFPIAGLLIEDFPFGESLIIGVGIALVMLVVNLFALQKTKKPIWEGTVVNKYKKEKYEHRGSDDDNYRTYTEFTTVITTDAGKKKTIVERDSGRHMYDYLSVGDRVRFHPKFGTYEKYDKSKDRIIYCNVCSMMNPIQNDRCKRCSNLLFK